MGSMNSAGHVFAFICWALAGGWLVKSVAALRGMPNLQDLSDMDPDALPAMPANECPDLTVVIPARDEEAAIGACLRSLVASTGLRLQIIAVDDRSDDGTG
jgi:cellulose synthase/poly-beta-1,6-N-acetylglucosamine synthase-like glycosyltransferase